MNKNLFFMNEAYLQAKRAKGLCSPNPAVGAILVRDNKIIAYGKTQKAGQDHAEIDVLKKIPFEKRKKASLYVTLEPCCHYGKTAPCTKAIIESGIENVFIGSLDSNPKVHGQGIRILKNAGINVFLDPFISLRKKIQKLNEDFNYFIQNKKPFITAKYAMTLDGKIAFSSGFSKWISGEKSRFYVQKIRNSVDAILVGTQTVIHDNPCLTVRLKNKKKDPLRIILNSFGQIPFNSNVVQDDFPSLFVMKKESMDKKHSSIQKMWVEFLITKKNKNIIFDPTPGNEISFDWLIKDLAKLEISSILIEGGGKTLSSALYAQCIQKIISFISLKKLMGINGISPFSGVYELKKNYFISLFDSKIKRIKDDLMISSYINYENYI